MLLSNLNLLATAPGGVARLRELILTLAVQGKLVAQDPKDEPASELLKKIRAEKDRLIAAGKIKRDKPLAEVTEGEKPIGLPKGWEWVRFGNASINRDGERVPVSSSDRDNRAKTYDYYGASGVIDKIDGFLFDKTLLLIGEDGANLINRSTPIAFLAHGKYWVNNHAHVIDTTHPELMTYLALFINAISLVPYVTGTAQPKMNQAKLNSIVIGLPPLAEQSRIVTRVEELMRLCDALDAKGQLEAAQHAQLVTTLLGSLTQSDTPAQLAEAWQRLATHFDLLLDRPKGLDALEQTILQLAVRGLLVPQDPTDEPASELLKKIRLEKDRLILEGKIKRDKALTLIAEEEKPFGLPQGWEWVRVGQVSGRVQYGVTASADHTLSEPKFVRITDIQNDQVNWETVPGMQGIKQDVSDHYLEAGDLLIARTGGTIGKSFLVSVVPLNAVFASYLIRISPMAGMDSNYLKIFASSEHYWQQLYAKSMGTGQPNVNGTALSELTLPLPPLAEQSRIVTRVESLRRLCADLRQRLSASQSTQAQLAEALVAQPNNGETAEQ
jgi:type I restriction enzyme S subunit